MKITVEKIGVSLIPYDQHDGEKLESLSNGIYTIDLKDMDTRTLKQNNALHLWCSQISKLLNSNQLYMKGVFGSDIEWTLELVKTQIVKATIKQVFNLSSTTKLKRKQIDELIDYVTIAFATKQIEIPPFPSKELWDNQ